MSSKRRACIAFFAALLATGPVRAHDEANPRAMLRAARRYADEANRKAKQPEARLLSDIADEQFRAGDIDGARDSLRAALAALPPSGPCPASNLLIKAARAQWESGMVAEASATMKTVLDAGLKADHKRKKECLESLVTLQTDLGLLNDALVVAALIPGARKTELYAGIAVALARQGRWEDSIAATELSSPTEGFPALVAAMDIRAAAGEWREATAAIKKEEPEYVDKFLEGVAVSAAQAGDFSTATQVAKSLKDPGWYFWEQIALSRARHGQAAEGIRTVLSKMSKDHDYAAAILITVASVQAESGDVEGAEKTRRKALEISSKGNPTAHFRRRVWVLAQESRIAEIEALTKDINPAERDEDLAFIVENECGVNCAVIASELAPLVTTDPSPSPNSGSEKFFEALARLQIRKGDAAEALRILPNLSRSSYTRDPLITEIAEALARGGDMRGAVATIGMIEPEMETYERPAAIQGIAAAQMEGEEIPDPPGWISGLPYADEKARAWLGAARGLRHRAEARKRR